MTSIITAPFPSLSFRGTKLRSNLLLKLGEGRYFDELKSPTGFEPARSRFRANSVRDVETFKPSGDLPGFQIEFSTVNAGLPW
jgi:hypothetical protein